MNNADKSIVVIRDAGLTNSDHYRKTPLCALKKEVGSGTWQQRGAWKAGGWSLEAQCGPSRVVPCVRAARLRYILTLALSAIDTMTKVYTLT